MNIFIPIVVGFISYLTTQFFIKPLTEIMALRKNMHQAILQYSNIWSIDPNDAEYSISRMHAARETYRSLAAQGISEAENLNSKPYFLAKIYLQVSRIKIKEASEKFWAMEADICDPQNGSFRRTVTGEIRTYLKLPKE